MPGKLKVLEFMTKEYTHYGKKVTFMSCIGDYRDILKSKNIKYEDVLIPDKNCRLIRYDSHYALIKLNRPGTMYEVECDVYVFDELPEDLMFNEIIDDVRQQSFSYEPKQKRSMTYHLIKEAVNNTEEVAEKDFTDPLGFTFPTDESRCKAAAEYLKEKYNITAEEFEKMEHDDCNIIEFEHNRVKFNVINKFLEDKTL